MMRVYQVDTNNEADVRAFVRFPFQLYADCPQWVPPLIADEERILDQENHPFYEHSDADFFLVKEGAEILGRIAVMEKRRYNAYKDVKAAFFGYLEMVNDLEVSRRLFEAAFDWARSRGLRYVYGPNKLGGLSGGGALVEGFEHRPAMGVAYNYDYYDALIRDVGFQSRREILSGYFSRSWELPERVIQLAEKVKVRRGFWIKTFEDEAEMREWIPRVAEVHQRAFTGREDFYPATEAEIEAFAQTIMQITDPGMVKLVMKESDLVGFVIIYPDISAGLQKARGRLWPLGWFHIWWARKRTKWANANGIGVLPQYQGLGASVMLYAEAADTLLKHGFEHVDVVQVGAENFKSRSAMEALGVEWYKRHRVYEKDLGTV